MRKPLTVLLTALLVTISVLGAAHAADPPGEISEWDEQVNGPLPRWRQGGTPKSAPDQRLTPTRIDIPRPTDAPESCSIDSPPEYSPTAGVLFRFSNSAWPSVVVDLVSSLTGDPAHDEIAYVVVANSSVQASAASQFQAAGADMSKVEFIIMPSDSIWLRDYGPHFIWQGGARAIVDSHYYPTRPLDNFIPTLVADDLFREPSYDIGLYYSGGNFQPGPARNGFVTSLIHLDNQGFGETFIGELYQEYQGIDTLHIMPKLPSSVDGTGHIDMWFYLVDEDTVIISEFIPGSNSTAIEITNNAVPYMEDLGFEVFRVPAKNQGGVHYTYTNAFRVNDRIFVPTYAEGDSDFLLLDAQALNAWQQAAGPGVEIIGINSYSIIPAAGAIHCIVMQVPRYTDVVPSACLASPNGGELLVAGNEHPIAWVASDDVSIDAVDLFLSTDGSTYEPIALEQWGGRREYQWTVPLIETDTAQVKVVVDDTDANSAEAQSEAEFDITTALQRVYDFSSGAGTDHQAWGYQTSTWNSLNGVRRPSGVNVELSSAAYAAISESDATGSDSDSNRYKSPNPLTGWESTHIFELTIEEDPSQMVDIGISWEGYGDQCLQMELYVWDYFAERWCDGNGQYGENRFLDNFAGNRDDDLSGHIRSNFERFIDASGQMTLLVYAERSGQESFHDYVSVTVTYEACLGTDADFDGWGDDCDNCPLVASEDQTNDDGDLRGNVCDCAPLDGTVFDVPFEIENLRLDSLTLLAWDSDAPNSGSGTVYDVIRGGVADVGIGYGDACLANGLSTPSVEDPELPLAGTGFYYLVRGANACGQGPYGFDSDGFERESEICP